MCILGFIYKKKKKNCDYDFNVCFYLGDVEQDKAHHLHEVMDSSELLPGGI